MVLAVRRREACPGGAANVAALAAGLGAVVTCAGAVGDDPEGRELERLLRDHGITPRLLIDDERPTSVKERLMGAATGRQPSQILRVDRESCAAIPVDRHASWADAVVRLVSQHDVVVLSDYAKGVCTAALVSRVTAAARRAGVPVLVDPGHGVPLRHYAGATLIKPNRAEAATALGMDDVSADRLRDVAVGEAGAVPADYLLVTLDADGMVLLDPRGSVDHFPADARDVCDITGAGDAVIAMVAVAWGGGLEPRDAVALGNVAGGIEVRKRGVAPIERREVVAELLREQGRHASKIMTLAQAASYCRSARDRAQRVVLTNGCFDLLHFGHVTYLQEAKMLGDLLVVAINSDASVRRLKGPDRPVIDQSQRAAMLASLECVDAVVVFDEPTPHRVLESIRPDVLVKGGTYRVEEVVGREIVEAYGGQVTVVGLVEGLSTTRIVESIRGERPAVRRAG